MASHKRLHSPGPAARAVRATALSAAAAAATAALSGTTAQLAAADPGPGPGRDRAVQVDRLDRLYRQAERATETYDAAQEQVQRQRQELSGLQDRVARSRQRVNELLDALGEVAAGQYRDGGIDPAVVLLMSGDPESYLDRAAALDRVSAQQTGQLRELRTAERALERQRAQAAAELAEVRRSTAVLQERKNAVQRALATARRLLSALPPVQRAAYSPLTGSGRASRDTRPAGAVPPVLPVLPAPSGRAALAVAAVRQALGSPYVWGASGPNAFDCSGLMQWAYAQAGVRLPRTSQEQMNAGTRVPPAEARPGDLVVYRSDASHIAMYVGGGQVVHAPYPGARVRYDPVDMMPVTAVTRP